MTESSQMQWSVASISDALEQQPCAGPRYRHKQGCQGDVFVEPAVMNSVKRLPGILRRTTPSNHQKQNNKVSSHLLV